MTDRLAGLARLWGAIKFLHPALVRRQMDWDAELRKVLPAVESARNDTEYAQALSELVNSLSDAASYIEPTGRPEGADAKSTLITADDRSHVVPAYRILDGALIVDCSAAARYATSWATLAALPDFQSQASKRSTIVFDCRARESGEARLWAWNRSAAGMLYAGLSALVEGSCTDSSLRYRTHRGYHNQVGVGEAVYWSAVEQVVPQSFSGRSQFGTGKRVIVLLNEHIGPIFFRLMGLQACGKIRLVEEKGDHGLEAALVSNEVSLVPGLRAQVRMSEIVNADGTIGFTPDQSVDRESPTGSYAFSDGTLELAVKLGKQVRSKRSGLKGADSELREPQEKPYVGMDASDEGLRLLALFRFWNIIDYFYPYKDLIKEPWFDVLSEFIPKFQGVHTRLEYEGLLMELAAKLPDSHVQLWRPRELLRSLGGDYVPAIELRVIDKQVVVTHAEFPAAGLEAGDIIESIDGESLIQRMARYRSRVAQSTEEDFDRSNSLSFTLSLAGPRSSLVSFQVRKPGGDDDGVSITVPRTVHLRWTAPDPTSVTNELTPNVSYIDLTRVKPSDDAAVRQALSKPALILDMRGYPRGNASELVQSIIASDQPVTIAELRIPVVSGASGLPASLELTQEIGPGSRPYRGNLFVLINEDTQSQAEHICLTLKAGSPYATFIGSSTAGADGNITDAVLPGGYLVSFTGMGVRQADGSRLQGVGIRPDIAVAPTIDGVRRGQDEVLTVATALADRRLH